MNVLRVKSPPPPLFSFVLNRVNLLPPLSANGIYEWPPGSLNNVVQKQKPACCEGLKTGLAGAFGGGGGGGGDFDAGG